MQSIEDFEKEHAAQYEQNVQRVAQTAKPKKQKKPDVSAIDFQLETDALNEIGTENWVGKLLEYRQAHHVPSSVPNQGLSYRPESSSAYITPRATVFLTIAEAPVEFGGVWFSNKQSAKQYASKKAVDWLIANNEMPADGSVSFLVAVPAVVQNGSPGTTTASAEGYASLVPELAHKLGLNVPKYEYREQSPGVPFYDAWADFGGDPRIKGRVGFVQSVYGKRKARDQVAKEVYSFLQDIERQRLGAQQVQVDIPVSVYNTFYNS